MKAEQDVREILIANTIRLIAEGGFEKATTKAITYSGEALTSVKMNEVYIYRLFGNKEQLYDAVFERLDKELLYVLYDCVKEINALSESNKDALYKVFLKVWSFVVGNEERCRAF